VPGATLPSSPPNPPPKPNTFPGNGQKNLICDDIGTGRTRLLWHIQLILGTETYPNGSDRGHLYSLSDDGQTIANYLNHYNFRLNKCFYLERSTTYPRSKDEGQFNSSRLFDLQERREIGTYQQLEDEVVLCDVQGKECHSLLEYQTLIKPFMKD
jgi:hypothetical protein